MKLGHSSVEMSKEDNGPAEFKLLHQLSDDSAFYDEKYVLFVLSYKDQEVGWLPPFMLRISNLEDNVLFKEEGRKIRTFGQK